MIIDIDIILAIPQEEIDKAITEKQIRDEKAKNKRVKNRPRKGLPASTKATTTTPSRSIGKQEEEGTNDEEEGGEEGEDEEEEGVPKKQEPVKEKATIPQYNGQLSMFNSVNDFLPKMEDSIQQPSSSSSKKNNRNSTQSKELDEPEWMTQMRDQARMRNQNREENVNRDGGKTILSRMSPNLLPSNYD